MEDKKYQALFFGEILPGADVESVKTNLARAFKVDKSRIEALFAGGKKIVKKDATRDLCEKTKKIFESAGAVISVVPQRTGETPPPPAGIEPETEAAPARPVAQTSPASPEETIAAKSSSGTVPSGAVNKTTLLLLTFFLGGFGVHKFYLARYIQGTLSILFCWTGIPGLIAMVEFFIYAFAGEEELNRKYKTGSTPLVIMMAVFGPFFFMAMVAIFMAIAVPLILVISRGDITFQTVKKVAGPPAAAGKAGVVSRGTEDSGTITPTSDPTIFHKGVVAQDRLYFSDGTDTDTGSGQAAEP